jgi:hypothetical protein
VVGAAAPEIVRVYRILSGQSKARLPNFSWWFVAFSVGFLFLGGYVAGLLVEAGVIADQRIKCFGAGAALPMVVSALALRFKVGTSEARKNEGYDAAG